MGAARSLAVRLVVAGALVAVLFPVALPAQPALACRCLAPRDTTQAANDASAVFTGVVASVQDSSAIVQIDRVWKGRLPASILLDQGLLEQCDGVALQVGEQYLFFASVAGTRYDAKGCKRTLRVGSASHVLADLDALSPASSPAPEPRWEVPKEVAAHDDASRWAYPVLVGVSLAAAGLVLWAGGRR